jgi:hypothetical protein
VRANRKELDMPEVADKSAWIRLGKLLERQRVTLDPRYSNLSLFAQERGINYRMAWDAEQAQRTNYRNATRLAIDIAYGWEPGSFNVVLAGGEPSVAGKAGNQGEDWRVAECLYEQEVLSTPDIGDDSKRQLVRVHRRRGHSERCGPFAEPAQDERASALPAAAAG